jgi:hypothetical protein
MNSFKHELRARLRQDPERASPDFTRTVLERIEQRPQRAWILLRPRLAMAAALVLLALGAILGARLGEQAPEPVADREQLVREFMEMQAELEQIRHMAEDSSPVLYLGGDESVDVLFDLRNYDTYVGSSNIRPASLSTDG